MTAAASTRFTFTGNAQACAFIELSDASGQLAGEHYGVGIDGNIVAASLHAVFSAVQRVQQRREPGVAAPLAERASA